MSAVPSLALIGGRWLDQLALKTLRPNCFQHLLQRDTLGVITNVAQVFVQIDVHPLNTGKPCQGFLDPIGSGVSGNVLPLDHALDIEGNILDIRRCRRVGFFGQRMDGGTCLRGAAGYQQAPETRFQRSQHSVEHKNCLSSRAHANTSRHVQKPTTNTAESQVMT